MATKLRDPYPSSPSHPPAYNLYMSRRGDEDTQCAVVGFREIYAGRRFMDELLRDDGWVWETESRVRSESGIVVRCSVGRGDEEAARVMHAIMDHELTPAEMGFEFTGSWARVASNFRNRREPTEAAERHDRPRREKKSRGPTAPHPPGALHVKELAMQMGVEPREARAALRKIMSKPAYGWYFAPSEVDDVKARIKEKLS